MDMQKFLEKDKKWLFLIIFVFWSYSEVFSLYLAKEDFQGESALVVWSVALARLWLMTCDPADKTKVQKKIFNILPLNMKVTGKREQSFFIYCLECEIFIVIINSLVTLDYTTYQYVLSGSNTQTWIEFWVSILSDEWCKELTVFVEVGRHTLSLKMIY